MSMWLLQEPVRHLCAPCCIPVPAAAVVEASQEQRQGGRSCTRHQNQGNLSEQEGPFCVHPRFWKARHKEMVCCSLLGSFLSFLSYNSWGHHIGLVRFWVCDSLLQVVTFQLQVMVLIKRVTDGECAGKVERQRTMEGRKQSRRWMGKETWSEVPGFFRLEANLSLDLGPSWAGWLLKSSWVIWSCNADLTQ